MKKLQQRKLRKRIWMALIVLCCAMFAVSVWKLADIYRDYKRGEEIYSDIENGVRETAGLVENTKAEEMEEPDETKDSEGESEEVPVETKPQTPLEELHAAHHIQKELGLNGFTLRQVLAEQYVFDFDKLEAINPDVVGWIIVDGTNIDYPIVKSKDNAEYLNMTLSGEYNKAGSIFLDNRCQELFGWNTVIYGHNMRNTSMFHDVENYRDPQYLKAHPLIHIITREETRTFQIYSCYETPGVSKTFANITSNNLYRQYIDYSVQSSEYATGVTVSYEDKIITLSTCTNDFNGHRYIVHAKQIY